MNIVADPIEKLEDAGYVAYWNGILRSDLTTEAEQHGWDDAHGEDLYCQAMWEEAKYVDQAQGEFSDWRWA